MIDQSFQFQAKCHLPGQDEVLEFKPLGLEQFSGFEDYWMKRTGMLFYPFDSSKKAYFFSNDDVLNEVKELVQTTNEPLSKEEYQTSILLAQNEMKEGSFDKVVLARNEITESQLSASDAFENARTIYNDSYCYMVDLEMEQWVGASPELLMHYEGGVFKTVALAGTKLLNEEFTAKEEEEQQMVESFIEERLKASALKFEKSAKVEEAFNQIKHLKTAYTVQCTDDQALELLKELHPTSAVCGLPRRESYEFITDYETLNRTFYSGMTGILTESSATFFVNLRCMRFINGKVELFAGAGITSHSDPEDEWNETERKIASIKAMLGS